jgi:hypothetical protein
MGALHNTILAVRSVRDVHSGSGEDEDEICGAPECTRRSVLSWTETATGGRIDGVEEVVLQVGEGVTRVEVLLRALPDAAGSGEVAESWMLSVAV